MLAVLKAVFSYIQFLVQIQDRDRGRTTRNVGGDVAELQKSHAHKKLEGSGSILDSDMYLSKTCRGKREEGRYRRDGSYCERESKLRKVENKGYPNQT